MFLLRSIDLIALVSLFVQTFVAWIFVAILAAVRTGGRGSLAFRAFFGAFGALALALTFVSIRFSRSHDAEVRGFWQDGGALAISCYVGYLGSKALFGWQLLCGAVAIAGGPARPVGAATVSLVVAAHAALPLAIRDVNWLLVAQVPVLIGVGAFGAWLLRGASGAGPGRKLVRAAFAGLAATWLLHAVAVLLLPRFPGLRYLLACNSLFDLAVQLVLGAGVLLCVLEEAHQRARAAEQERERLQRTLARDERLRALGTLVSGVAHELNNPLVVILGHCDLLPGGDAADAPARIVAEQAQRCRGIVRDLSALSGQVRRHREALDARDVADRIVRGIAAVHRAGDRRIVVEVPARLVFQADRIGVEQVLTNLVVNALQASPAGGVVRLRAADGVEGGIDWEVEDEGEGVPEELRDRLFEPFFTTKRPGEGTGLGLSIAQAIVRAHGGTITVGVGARGRGANFRVTLPAADPAAAAAPGGEGNAPAAGVASARRLLVVDDDPAVRAVVARQARRRGFEVTEAASAEEALEVAAGPAVIDAVACDVRMRGIGGIGFHDRAETVRAGLLARTVFITGDLASPEAAGFAARCVRPILQKPFDYDELFTALTASSAGARAS